MKKSLIIITLTILTGTTLFSQSIQFNTIYDKYKHEPEVVNLFVPGFLMKLAANIDDNLSWEEVDLLRSIKSIKLLTVENDILNMELNFVDEFNSRPLSDKYMKLLEAHEKENDILILARMKNDRMQDMMIVVGGEENVLVRIKGRMDADLMHILQDATGIEQMGYAEGINLE